MQEIIIFRRKIIAAIFLLWMSISLTVLYLAIEGAGIATILNITAAINLGGALGLVWKYTNKGQSFLFLFTSLLILFLGGRLFTTLLGYDYYPEYISFGGETYVGIDAHIKYVTLMQVAITGLLAGMSVTRRKIKREVQSNANSDKFLRFLNFCIVVTLPFYLYKNYLYYKFLSAQGGYIAMYLSTEHLDQAGFIIRTGALACQTILLARVFFARERTQYLAWMIFFGIVFLAELVIGLRGKYFVIILALFFVYIVRYNLKLSLLKLIIIFTVVALASIIIEQFREQKAESTLVGFLLLGFLHQQSVSADVVKGVIAFSEQLGSGIEYLFRQFFIPFIHPTEVGRGWFLSDDFSRLVMPEAYLNGFGTGSSYIAELYLIGGVGLIFIFNFLIAIYLINIRFGPNVKDFYKFVFVTGILYFPRSTLNDPLGALLKYGVVFAAFILIYLILRRIRPHESAS